MSTKARVLLTVAGRVQGVGFRYFAQGAAAKRGLKGFVRNLEDGSVESVVEGEKSALDLYIRDLRAGPSSSLVLRVDTRWEEFTGEFKDFQITF